MQKNADSKICSAFVAMIASRD